MKAKLILNIFYSSSAKFWNSPGSNPSSSAVATMVKKAQKNRTVSPAIINTLNDFPTPNIVQQSKSDKCVNSCYVITMVFVNNCYIHHECTVRVWNLLSIRYLMFNSWLNIFQSTMWPWDWNNKINTIKCFTNSKFIYLLLTLFYYCSFFIFTILLLQTSYSIKNVVKKQFSIVLSTKTS